MYVQLRREFAIASVRAHDAFVPRSGLFLLGGWYNILPVPGTLYGPAEEGAVSCIGRRSKSARFWTNARTPEGVLTPRR